MRESLVTATVQGEDSETSEEEDDMAPGSVQRRYGHHPDSDSVYSTSFPPSDFVPTRSVRGLASNNFSKFLGDKHAALVMFYDPDCLYCNQAKPHFMKAAKTVAGEYHGFASVDCTKEKELCELEQVRNLPQFKLYVGGRFLANYNNTPDFTNIAHFMKSAPINTVVKEPIKKSIFNRDDL